jgi:hypothetical protein
MLYTQHVSGITMPIIRSTVKDDKQRPHGIHLISSSPLCTTSAEHRTHRTINLLHRTIYLLHRKINLLHRTINLLHRTWIALKFCAQRKFLFVVSEVMGLEELLNPQISTAMQTVWESSIKAYKNLDLTAHDAV